MSIVLAPSAIRERLAEVNPEAILYDGCDDALVGMASRCAQPTLGAYSYSKLVRVFEGQGMTHDEAHEWIEFNIAGGWLGPHTPIIIEDREAV